MRGAQANLAAQRVFKRLKGESGEEEENLEITLEHVDEFYRFLTGDRMPEGMQIKKSHRPKMSEDKAATIIWFLQEHFAIIPDSIERCDGCGELYDSHSSGCYTEKPFEGKHFFCGTCEFMLPPDYDDYEADQ